MMSHLAHIADVHSPLFDTVLGGAEPGEVTIAVTLEISDARALSRAMRAIDQRYVLAVAASMLVDRRGTSQLHRFVGNPGVAGLSFGEVLSALGQFVQPLSIAGLDAGSVSARFRLPDEVKDRARVVGGAFMVMVALLGAPGDLGQVRQDLRDTRTGAIHEWRVDAEHANPDYVVEAVRALDDVPDGTVSVEFSFDEGVVTARREVSSVAKGD